MASRKEFKRKQKAEARKAKKEQRLEAKPSREVAEEINTLNLLAVPDESNKDNAPPPDATENAAAEAGRVMPPRDDSGGSADSPAPEKDKPPATKDFKAKGVERLRRKAEAARARSAAGTGEQAEGMPAKIEESRQRDGSEAESSQAAPIDGFALPPPLEVEHPYWQKPVGVFDMMSGAPHGWRGEGAGEYGGENADAGSILPATCAEDRNTFESADFPDDDKPDIPKKPEPRETKPVPVEKRMYIVMVTPEVAPCAKVGGLGDVILGLGRELMRRGHGVEVICPMYAGMRYDLIYDLHEEYGELWCPHNNEWRAEKVFQGKVEGGLQVNFITGGTYTERPNIYGYDDDMQRFAYFSRQALEFMYKTNRRPDIIHCHDWATGLTPAILWDVYQKLGWNNSRVVYTIHNNECQGLCGFGGKLLALVGLDVRNYHRPDRMQDDVHKNCINMMKGGIVYSNFVTTVSPTYAGELKTVVGGRGLEHTIARNSVKVGGVLNGIDYESWNPRTDPKLAARYSDGDDFNEKYKNKNALREWLGLWDAWRPIVSVVTRLTRQKGLDLIKHAIFSTLALDGQFVLLGSAPDPKVNAEFLRLQYELRDNHNVNLYIGYHEDLSRLIYAGSDMFLIPSLYEPCGLTQMISLRYGTVPIVRETGGLVDTVFDLENSGRGLGDANGFTFREPSDESVDYGLRRAIRLWYDNPEAFRRLALNGMRYDYSWRHPAEHYENIYNYIKA